MALNFIRKYNSWNYFEKKYFWNCLILSTMWGLNTINILKNIEKYPLFNILNFMFISLSLYFINSFIHKKLSEQEKEWKELGGN